MADWELTPPRAGSIATGFFPEAKPKQSWASNPRPLLILRVYVGSVSKTIQVLVAYGTSRTNKPLPTSLMIGNLSILDELNLSRPTAFVLEPGSNLAILPWDAQHFGCWRGFTSPVISRIPQDMQLFALSVLNSLTDVPTPKNPKP